MASRSGANAKAAAGHCAISYAGDSAAAMPVTVPCSISQTVPNPRNACNLRATALCAGQRPVAVTAASMAAPKAFET